MNKVILTGRIAQDLELRYTNNGIAVVTFNLAVERPAGKGKEPETDWPTIVAWRQKAEFVSKYLSKGRKILVTGNLRTRSYEDKDGNKRKVVEVQAEDIEFCDSRPQNNPGEAAGSGAEHPGFIEVDTSNEELPF